MGNFEALTIRGRSSDSVNGGSLSPRREALVSLYYYSMILLNQLQCAIFAGLLFPRRAHCRIILLIWD